MSNIVLSLQRVTKIFGGKGDVPLAEIFKGMDFNVKRNEVVGLFSPSGSGKTTFLQIAGLLDSQFSGDIYINGSKVDTKNDFQTSIIRRKNIGFVFQFHHLIQEFSALENIIFPLLFEGISKGIAVRKGQQLLEKVGLGKRMDNRPAELSGGEQQRVAICRAIINEPTLLLADEPTGNLDQSTTSKVMSFLIELIKEHNISAIIASHNPTISQLVDKNAKIADGKIVYD
jgi:lipoprotein-releasing system ATP-binding protein|tara:strand:+ start:143 stop:829 length:687 start_codon:yes stop_codon:yes gene_type:complete